MYICTHYSAKIYSFRCSLTYTKNYKKLLNITSKTTNHPKTMLITYIENMAKRIRHKMVKKL